MGEKIRQLRERAGLSQKQLAEALGLDQSSVSLWERGITAPTVGTIYRLASVLGCHPGDLF